MRQTARMDRRHIQVTSRFIPFVEIDPDQSVAPHNDPDLIDDAIPCKIRNTFTGKDGWITKDATLKNHLGMYRVLGFENVKAGDDVVYNGFVSYNFKEGGLSSPLKKGAMRNFSRRLVTRLKRNDITTPTEENLTELFDDIKSCREGQGVHLDGVSVRVQDGENMFFVGCEKHGNSTVIWLCEKA